MMAFLGYCLLLVLAVSAIVYGVAAYGVKKWGAGDD